MREMTVRSHLLLSLPLKTAPLPPLTLSLLILVATAMKNLYFLGRIHTAYSLRSLKNPVLSRLLSGCTIDVTVLRHPVPWLKRVYARFRTIPNSHFRLKRGEQNESLASFIKREPTAWNFATKFFGSDDVTHFDGSIQHHNLTLTLASAKERLNAFHFVGVYERLDDAVELVAHRLCWDSGRLLWSGAEKADGDGGSGDGEAPALDMLIRKHMELDLRLVTREAFAVCVPDPRVHSNPPTSTFVGCTIMLISSWTRTCRKCSRTEAVASCVEWARAVL